ncbi:MAG TPA: GNAT family N-acetyltransferase [Dyella sp.]
MTHRLLSLEKPTLDDREAIAAPLRAYNHEHAPPMRMLPVAILLQDEHGQTVGGLWGKTMFDWLYVELLAVPESMRGHDVGTALMREAEQVAQDRGCVGAWLDTFAFQARGFYERLGYDVFGEIPDHPVGSARYFLSKRFG